MEHFVGIDVAKDRLDVHLRPSAESFTAARDGEALAQLVDRLQNLAPRLVVMEATGGYETIVASAVAAAQLPLPSCRWRWSTRARSAISPAPPASWPKPMRSTPRRLRILPKRSARRSGRLPTPRHRRWTNW